MNSIHKCHVEEADMNSNNPSTVKSCLETYNNDIQDLRTQINIIDDQIAKLLKERLEHVFEAREIKQVDGIPLHCAEREAVVIKNVTFDSCGLEKEYLEEIYSSLLAITRKVADQKLLQ